MSREFAVSDDLNKAEQEWARRSLFRPQRRRRGRWLLLTLLVIVVATILQFHEEFFTTL